MACYLLGSPGSPGKSYQHPATVPAVHRLALSRNGLAQACEGHTGEELLQLAQTANANNVNQPFDGAWCYIVPYVCPKVVSDTRFLDKPRCPKLLG